MSATGVVLAIGFVLLVSGLLLGRISYVLESERLGTVATVVILGAIITLTEGIAVLLWHVAL